MLSAIDEVTREHGWRLSVQQWICPCGCDTATALQRTSKGLAYTQQAWPVGMRPGVIFLESDEDVEGWLTALRQTALGKNPERYDQFTKWVWETWNSGSA